MLTTAVSKFSAPARALALASAFACLALAGCATPVQPDGSPAPKTARPLPPAQVVAGFAEYVDWLARQGAPELEAERDRLYALPDSGDRDLRLALIYGTHSFTSYNPGLSARLLMEVAIAEPQGSAYGQLAQVLLASQPDPEAFEEARLLKELSVGLTAQLTVEQARIAGLETQLDVARKELDSERTERARLENQLKALKSLEAQIKGRDEANQ